MDSKSAESLLLQPYLYKQFSPVLYFEQIFHELLCSSARFYVCGLNLTEDARYVILHPRQDLKTMTMKALSPLLRWTGEQRPGPEVGGVNIVCCDFVGVGQFCSIVIDLNYKLMGGASTLHTHTAATSTGTSTDFASLRFLLLKKKKKGQNGKFVSEKWAPASPLPQDLRILVADQMY